MEQAQQLLADAVGYAGTLRTIRTSISSLVVIALGVGLFKMDLFGRDGEIPRVEPWAMLAIRVLVSAGLILLTVGLYWPYTEKPLLKEMSEHPRPRYQKCKSQSALAVLNVTDSVRRSMEKSDEVVTIQARTRILADAYTRLSAANRRVRYRIEVGQRWIFGGVVALFAAFAVYVWGLSGGPANESGHQPTPAGASGPGAGVSSGSRVDPGAGEGWEGL